MLDNEFDQIFRDRLLDHSSKIRLTLWKQLNTHLLRHKAFHLWKWYFVGPSAVVVAVTGFFIVKTIQSSSHNKHTANVTAVAACESRPAADSPATQPITSTQPTTTLDSHAANPRPTAANPRPTPANPNTTAAARTASSTANRTASTAVATTNATAAAASTTGTAPASEPLHRSTANSPSSTHTAQDLAAHQRSPTPTNTRAHTHHRPLSRSHNKKAADAMAGDIEDARVADDGQAINNSQAVNNAQTANNTQTANDVRSPNRTTGTHNTKPGNTKPGNTRSGLTRTRDATQSAPVKLITLKTPAVVTAKTPNSKSPHQLIVPAPRSRTHIPFYVDLFGAPEYFTWKTIGLSYGAGARVTVIFKNHWTITSGVQYLRINVNHISGIDSLSGLQPGYFTNFHIPLLLGYTTGNDRFSLSVNAGVLFSLYTQANGSLKNADNWSNRDGLNSYLGINFSTHITNRVSLFAEPYLKCWYPPGDQRLPPQLWSTGLTVGFRCKF